MGLHRDYPHSQLERIFPQFAVCFSETLRFNLVDLATHLPNCEGNAAIVRAESETRDTLHLVWNMPDLEGYISFTSDQEIVSCEQLAAHRLVQAFALVVGIDATVIARAAWRYLFS